MKEKTYICVINYVFNNDKQTVGYGLFRQNRKNGDRKPFANADRPHYERCGEDLPAVWSGHQAKMVSRALCPLGGRGEDHYGNRPGDRTDTSVREQHRERDGGRKTYPGGGGQDGQAPDDHRAFAARPQSVRHADGGLRGRGYRRRGSVGRNPPRPVARHRRMGGAARAKKPPGTHAKAGRCESSPTNRATSRCSVR